MNKQWMSLREIREKGWELARSGDSDTQALHVTLGQDGLPTGYEAGAEGDRHVLTVTDLQTRWPWHGDTKVLSMWAGGCRVLVHLDVGGGLRSARLLES